MPKGAKSTNTNKQKRKAAVIEQGHEQNVAPRPETATRTWPTLNKLNGAGMKGGSRAKVPSGPIGGSGRKTNLSRSS